MTADPDHEPGEAPFGMTDLEERLRGPDAAATLTALMSRLAQVSGAIAGSVRAGLKPDDFKRAEVLEGSLAVARTLLGRFSSAKNWEK